MSIELTFTKYFFFWIFLVLLLLLTGFIAGVYPALYVSSFSPVNVMKGASPFKGSGKLIFCTSYPSVFNFSYGTWYWEWYFQEMQYIREHLIWDTTEIS